jgi:hypothetical protein
MGIDKVAASHFYQDDGDKIAQNWFLYEYANNLLSKIEDSPKLAAYRKRRRQEDIVAFCVYFTKRLRRSIAQVHEKQTPGVVIDARYIYEFYPDNTRAQTQRLLEVAGEAWGEKIKICANCPNGCLANGFDRTDMFDSLEETGWPTR